MIEKIEPYLVIRECLRNYSMFKDAMAFEGIEVISHGDYTISFLDLQKILHEDLKGLSRRKREAIYYNVVLGKKQKEVAEIMGITTVSVGQYVKSGCTQLAEKYFPELSNAAA